MDSNKELNGHIIDEHNTSIQCVECEDVWEVPEILQQYGGSFIAKYKIYLMSKVYHEAECRVAVKNRNKSPTDGNGFGSQGTIASNVTISGDSIVELQRAVQHQRIKGMVEKNDDLLYDR